MLIFLVRNVRFGIRLVDLALNSARIDFVLLYRFPSAHQRDAAIPFRIRGPHHLRLTIVSLISMRWWLAHGTMVVVWRVSQKDPQGEMLSEAVFRILSAWQCCVGDKVTAKP